MNAEKVIPQFGSIYIAHRRNGRASLFRYLGPACHMRRPYDSYWGAVHCGVWVMDGNTPGQVNKLEPLNKKWLNRTMKGLARQIENRQKKLDIYKNFANLSI